MPTSPENRSHPATLAIVGRPNVGKSTLFNRIVGRRRAIVGDEPGITRDRLYGIAEWSGRRFRVVDTGGIVTDDKELIPSEIFRQARVGMEEADAIVLVVDGRTELTAPDFELARLLIRSGKSVFLAVNKIDTQKMEAAAENFRTLGIQRLYPISAEHSTGVAELLDAVMEVLPKTEPEEEEPQTIVAEDADGRREEFDPKDAKVRRERLTASQLDEKPTEEEWAAREFKIAIIGRPNVGKSTLLNALTSTERAIVSPIPGTTRDAIDEMIERDGRAYRFIDTAGIRRKGKTKLMAEKLSVVMARKHLEAADIALLVVDATEGITASDATIAGYAHESGRSLIIVVNKWDLVGKQQEETERKAMGHHRSNQPFQRSSGKSHSIAAAKPPDRKAFEERIRYELKFLSYAPVVFVSAKQGKNIDKLFAKITQVGQERRKRVPTSAINRFLETIDFDRASVPYNRRVRILYMTQASTSPPTFVLFVDRAVKLHFSYERFLENQIRDSFGFAGTPIWIKTRARNADKK